MRFATASSQKLELSDSNEYEDRAILTLKYAREEELAPGVSAAEGRDM